MKMKVKQNKGITLIALIITIVIMLILAIVTIAAVKGEGIIGKAKKAKTDYQNAQAEEQGIIDKYLNEMDNLVGDNGIGGNSLEGGNNTITEEIPEEIPEVITHYTAEEIEESQYLFGIGATQSTYVVAAFNEDYTEVVVTKNGEESDGVMMDFTPWTSQYSPMYNHRDTLQTAIIEEGIIRIGGGMSGGRSFKDCTNLINIQIPTSVTSIGAAFYNTAWYNAQPDGFIYINEGVYAYKGETTSTISIADGTKRIYDYAFESINWSSITIPASIISIGKSAFGNGNITIYCQTQEVADLLIDGTNYNSGTTTVEVDPSKF